MGVFDKGTNVCRAVPDPGTDDTLPSSGALSWGAITDGAGLAGTTGADAKFVHGDSWDVITGSLREIIQQNHTVLVQQNHMETVTGNQEMMVCGATNDMRMSGYVQTFLNASNFIYNLARTENHSSPEQQLNPTEETHVKASESVEKEKHVEGISWKIEGKGFGIEGVATKLEFWGAKNGIGVLGMEELALKHRSEILEQKLQGMFFKTKAAEVKTGGPEIKIQPVIIGICIAVHLDSPWG